MNIVVKYNGKQKLFHHYWLPLIYKHNECTFYIEDKNGSMIYPSGIRNLKVIIDINKENLKGKTLHCDIDKVPTYKTMTNFDNNIFYEVPLKE